MIATNQPFRNAKRLAAVAEKSDHGSVASIRQGRTMPAAQVAAAKDHPHCHKAGSQSAARMYCIRVGFTLSSKFICQIPPNNPGRGPPTD